MSTAYGDSEYHEGFLGRCASVSAIIYLISLFVVHSLSAFPAIGTRGWWQLRCFGAVSDCPLLSEEWFCSAEEASAVALEGLGGGAAINALVVGAGASRVSSLLAASCGSVIASDVTPNIHETAEFHHYTHN